MLPPSRTTTSASLVVAVAVLALAGCSEPVMPEGPVAPTGTDAAPPADDDADPDVDELTGQLSLLIGAIDDAQAHLDAAAEAGTAAQVRNRARDALGLLLEDTGPGPASGLLPAESPERDATADRSDLLGTTLALARDVGGDQGSAVLDLLRDEVAGDLGAWERDAAGVVAAAHGAAGASNDLDRLTERILELPGEATRALAWTFVAVDAEDAELGATAASRASAHLALARVALDELGVPAADDEGEG